MIPPLDPISPFEVFRMPIIIRRFIGGFYYNGIWQEGSQVALSTILITGNVVNITFNGVILSPITFTTSASVTMGLIASSIESQPFIDHVLTFTIIDNKIWLRNYQIVEENGSLAEIGPR